MKYYRGNNGISSRRQRKASRLSPHMKVMLVNKALRFALFGIIGLVVLLFLYTVWVSRSLPAPGKLSSEAIKDSTKIYDKDGELLYSFAENYNRIYVTLDQIPETLRNATIATEDRDFYKNDGFSWWAYARVLKDLIIHQRLTGGSTITQQLVKNILLSPERTPTRKLKELILAVQVDQRFSKDEILEMYLNNIPYGGTAIGVEAASSLYFDKHAKHLTLAESAFLAGLPQSPSYYSPFINPDKAYIPRSEAVLRRMREDGYISKKQEEEALKQIKSFKFSQKQTNLKAPHFVMDVRNQLIEMFGEAMVMSGNLTVKTTLDYDIQKEAEKIVKEELEKLKGYRVGNGAAMVMDAKDGAVLAMVGSKDYFDEDNQGNYNAARASRQPGSSLKPITYAVGLEKGYTPATLFMDVRTTFAADDSVKPYNPGNYDGKFQGPMQMRFALGNSQNIPAVKMLAKVGIEPVMQKGYDMGITNWEPTTSNMRNVGLSLVLGGREASLYQITSAYQVFANKGVKKESYEIVEVKDSKGKVLYKHTEDKGRRVLSEEVAFLISHMLLDNNARQPAFGARSWLVVPGKTVSVKTGTTDEKKDNWTIGYTPSYVVGVWVGNNDNTSMNQAIASGVTGATPIWNKVMSHVLKGKSDEQPQKPENVVALEIDAFGGGLPVEGQSKRVEYFVKGTEPTAPSPIYKKVKVSKADNNRLANDEEISRGDYDVKDFIVFEEEDPVSTDGKNRWQEAINAWVKERYKDDAKYNPPTETSDKKYDGDEGKDKDKDKKDKE